MESKKKQLVSVVPHECTGVDVSDTTAGQADVRSGKYFYSALGNRVEGQIADYSGAVSVTPTEQAQTVGTAGKYVENDITVGAIPSEYKDTTGTDATAGDMLAGKKAVTGAGLVTGSVETYAGATNVTQNGTLPTAGKFVPNDIEVNVPSQTPVLVTKNITANGTYTAASDSADGYSEVTVNVAAVSKLPQVVDKRVTSIYAADLAGATKIGERAFMGCANMTSFEFPNGIREIGQSAFYNCISLSLINAIPSSVRKIAYQAFFGTPLSEITLLSTTPPWLQGTNAISTATQTIYIPSGTLTAYQTATNWSAFSSKFVELPA